jgi:putative intracellular protease/amidase
MTKKELIKALDKYEDYDVVVCIGGDGAWDNIEKVEDFRDSIAICFGGGSPFTDEQ